MKNIIKLLEITHKGHQQKFDTIWVIIGKEGFGKSHLALNILEEWGRLTKQTITIRNISITRGSFLEALHSEPEKIGIVIMDEAADTLFSRDAMNQENKDLVKLFSVIREKGLFVILVIPSIWSLETYFREHRIKGLFKVEKRGIVYFWNEKGIKKIMRTTERYQDFKVRPSLIDTFPEYKGELLQEYSKLKHEKIKTIINFYRQKYAEGENNLTDYQRDVLRLRQSGQAVRLIQEQVGGNVGNTLLALRKKGFDVPKNPQRDTNNTAKEAINTI